MFPPKKHQSAHPTDATFRASFTGDVAFRVPEPNIYCGVHARCRVKVAYIILCMCSVIRHLHDVGVTLFPGKKSEGAAGTHCSRMREVSLLTCILSVTLTMH